MNCGVGKTVETCDEKANRIIARARASALANGAQELETVKGRQGFHISYNLPVGDDEFTPVGAYSLYADFV